MSEIIRIAIFLFIIYYVLASQLYIRTVLSKIPGALMYDQLSDKGLLVNASLMAILYILVDFLVKKNII